MAFENYGSKKAAAQRIDFKGMIRNLTEQEQLTQAALQQRKQEVQYYAEKMQTATSDIPYIQAKLDEFNKKTLAEIGKYTSENPQFDRSISGMAKFNSMTGKLLNNEIIAEGETSKKNYQAFQDAFNKGELTTEEFVNYSKQWEDYQASGNNGNPFQFSQPKRFTLSQITNEALQSGLLAVKTTSARQDGTIGTLTYITDKQAMEAAEAMYSNPLYRPSIEKAWRDMKGMYTTPEQMLQQLFKNSQETGYKPLTVDPIERYSAEYQAKYGGQNAYGNITFVNEIYGPLQRNGKTDSVLHSSVFTDAGDKGNSFNMGDPNIHVAMQTKDGDFKPLKNLDYLATVESSGYIFTQGGMPFATVNVSFKASPDEKERLERMGFQPKFYTEEAITDRTILMQERHKADFTYEGTVIMPVNITPGRIEQFERLMVPKHQKEGL